MERSSATPLHEFYELVGASLVFWERRTRLWASEEAENELRVSLAFVPVEILGSYLEDLLNLKVSDESLFIGKGRHSWALKSRHALSDLVNRACLVRDCDLVALFSSSSMFRWASLAGLVVAMAAGLIAARNGASLEASVFIALISGVPPAVVWYLSPRSARRRMRFAGLVSREISRRQGIPADSDGKPILPLSDGPVSAVWRGMVH